MAAILTVQGGIIMQNRQIDGHGLYLSLLAGLAVLCLAAALVLVCPARSRKPPRRATF